MPLKYFVCPDGEWVTTKQCTSSGGCRLKKRCLTQATLLFMAEQREWTGIPSVTQLLKGTKEMFLLITQDYAEDPDAIAFRLDGTSMHGDLEQNPVEGATIEERFVTSHGITGAPDILETEDGWHILTDYKKSGSFKVSKALGMEEVIEESKTEVYKQGTWLTINGLKVKREKGESKIIKSYKPNFLKRECFDWDMQVNYYRIGLEEKGKRIDEMRIQALVRDGGTASAQRYGLYKRFYLIPVPHLDNEKVIEYFLRKREQLMQALEQGYWESACTPDETWNGRKCDKFCSVKTMCEFSPHYGKKIEEINDEINTGTDESN